MSPVTDEKAPRPSSLKNVKWAAHFLGVSRNTIHQWVLEGHVPYINLGVPGGRRIIRFNPEAIEAWLYERSHAPAQKTESPEAGKEKTEREGRETE